MWWKKKEAVLLKIDLFSVYKPHKIHPRLQCIANENLICLYFWLGTSNKFMQICAHNL